MTSTGDEHQRPPRAPVGMPGAPPPPPLPLVGDADDEPPPLTVVAAEERRGAVPPAPTPPTAAELGPSARLQPLPTPVWLRLTGPLLAIGLTIYLARALGPDAFGLYVLALAIGAAALYAGWVGFPLVFGGVAPGDPDISAPMIDRPALAGRELRLPATIACAIVVFALAGAIADALARPRLGWPLRWVAIAVLGQALVWGLRERGSVGRESGLGAWICAAQSVIAAGDTVALVAGGAGLTGAILGQIPGLLVAAAALFLFAPRIAGAPTRGAAGSIVGAVRATAAADATWTAVVQVSAIVVAVIVSAVALGRFGVALTLTVALAYTGCELSGGLAGRAPAGATTLDASARRLRLMVRCQGATVAPLIVWAEPLTQLLFGDRYRAGASVLRVLAGCSFMAAPAWLLTLLVLRRGDVRSNLLAVSVAIEVGLIATYLLATADGIVGAAIGVDLLLAGYVGAHLRIATSLVDLEPAALVGSLARTAAAAIAMAAVLYGAGTHELSLAGWLSGTIGAVAAFIAVLLVSGEISVAGLSAKATGPAPPPERE